MEGTLGKSHCGNFKCDLGQLREGKDSRAAMDLSFVLGPVLPETLLGDMFNFRLGGPLVLCNRHI